MSGFGSCVLEEWVCVNCNAFIVRLHCKAVACCRQSSLGWARVCDYKNAMRLLDAPLNQWLNVLVFEGGARMQARLSQHGLFAGDRVRVLRMAPLDGPLLVEVNGREIALGRGIAEKIFVEAGE